MAKFVCFEYLMLLALIVLWIINENKTIGYQDAFLK